MKKFVDFKEQIGGVMKSIRENKGLKQKHVANLLGCRRQQIYNFESNGSFGFDFLIRYCLVCDVKLSDVIKKCENTLTY